MQCFKTKMGHDIHGELNSKHLIWNSRQNLVNAISQIGFHHGLIQCEPDNVSSCVTAGRSETSPETRPKISILVIIGGNCCGKQAQECFFSKAIFARFYWCEMTFSLRNCSLKCKFSRCQDTFFCLHHLWVRVCIFVA